MELIQYFINHQSQIFNLLMEHIQLTFISVMLATLIGIPTGILICYIKKLDKPILGAANIIQAIPSMALLGFAIPLFGIGTIPAVITVTLYSLLPIIKSTYTGIININPQVLESAKGIGLTRFQVLYKIQIPLALPVIMSGVRISSVTAVGLMTIAAFIGAGGLGYFVFSGIRTVNTLQILVGAIPACLLALAVDYIANIVEKLVTPINLQNQPSKSMKNLKEKRLYRKMILIFTSIFLVGIFFLSSDSANNPHQKTLSIGSKDFTEQHIIANMLADIIEANTDIKVTREINLGGTQVCFGALQSKNIDMYVDYTGTIYGEILGYTPTNNIKKVYSTAKQDLFQKYNMTMLNHLGFNNTYTMAVRQDTAQKYHLKTISDLSNIASSLKAGATLEFLNRKDGLLGVTGTYGFNFAGTIGLDGASRYIALNNNEVDIIDAFSTDGLIKKFDLVILEDNKNFFPPYYAVPIINNDTLEKYPEITPLIEKLGAVLNNKVMIELNYKVDELQIDPSVVSKEFLKENNLI